jgi:hypothetical protein
MSCHRFSLAKEGYDVNLLIDYGEVLFPPDMVKKAPEAVKDAKEAGRALAFELGTGCGFHVFRVVECVLRRYWDKVTNGKARPVPQTIGKFAAELENGKFGDEKIRECLKSITTFIEIL